MGLVNLTCDKCGASLILVKEGLYLCEHCNTVYKDEIQINSTTHNHNETIVKNYYGSATTAESNAEKCHGYLKIALRRFEDGAYKEADEYFIKALDIDPENPDAFAIDTIISMLRTQSRPFDLFYYSFSEILRVVVESDLLGESAIDKPCFVQLLYLIAQKNNIIIGTPTEEDLENTRQFNQSSIYDEIQNAFSYLLKSKCGTSAIDDTINKILELINLGTKVAAQEYTDTLQRHLELCAKRNQRKIEYDELLERVCGLASAKRFLGIFLFLLIVGIITVIIVAQT